MPGLFRDPATETYRYYSYNDYEERRRRDWDDRYGYSGSQKRYDGLMRKPPAPFQFAPMPQPTTEPSPPQPIPTLKTPEQVIFEAAGIQAPSPGIVPMVASWEGPTPQTATAVPFDFEKFRQSWNAANPPAAVGELPEFDTTFFDRLVEQGQSLDYRRTETDVLVPLILDQLNS